MKFLLSHIILKSDSNIENEELPDILAAAIICKTFFHYCNPVNEDNGVFD